MAASLPPDKSNHPNPPTCVEKLRAGYPGRIATKPFDHGAAVPFSSTQLQPVMPLAPDQPASPGRSHPLLQDTDRAIRRRCWRGVACALAVFGGHAAWAAAGPVAEDLSYATTVYSLEAGLPSDVAQNILQTRDGYLWVGTESGLSRFDGVRFVTFRVANSPGLADNRVRSLWEDKTGGLWVATQGGLSLYRGGKFERIGRFDKPVASVVGDPAGTIWIGTAGLGLWEYRDGKLLSHADDPVLRSHQDIWRLQVDATGRLWICFTGGGIACYEGGSFKPYDQAGADWGEINRVFEAPRGTFWFATAKGLMRLRDGQFRAFGREQGLGTEPVTHLYTDQQGRLWISAHHLYMAETPDAESFVQIPVAGVEYCRAIMQDHEGTYWIGTSGSGVARMRPSAFRMVSMANGLPFEGTRSVTRDRAGKRMSGRCVRWRMTAYGSGPAARSWSGATACCSDTPRSSMCGQFTRIVRAQSGWGGTIMGWSATRRENSRRWPGSSERKPRTSWFSARTSKGRSTWV